MAKVFLSPESEQITSLESNGHWSPFCSSKMSKKLVYLSITFFTCSTYCHDGLGEPLFWMKKGEENEKKEEKKERRWKGRKRGTTKSEWWIIHNEHKNFHTNIYIYTCSQCRGWGERSINFYTHIIKRHKELNTSMHTQTHTHGCAQTHSVAS